MGNMGNINNIGSTFGIDVRRKIYCTGNTSDWLKGEIDPNCLKRIAWQFEEVLTSATDQYGKAYDELTAGLREALKTFTKLLRGVSLGKDINSTSAESGESKSTQSALMEAAGAIAAFTGSDVDDKILAEAFMIAPKYNIPARSAVPKLQIPISAGGIKVCFSYGKAGLFNAKEEVWDPISRIMASLSPELQDSTKYEGLLSIDDGKTIPFEFQSKYYFIKAAATSGETGGKTQIQLTMDNIPNHTHSVLTSTLTTSSSGAHTHTYTAPVKGSSNNASDKDIMETSSTQDTSSAGEHTHTVNVSQIQLSSVGSGTPLDWEPKYYSLIYLMKIK